MFSENPDISSNLLYSLLPSSFVQFLSQGPISRLVHWSVNLKAWTSHPKMASTINQPSAKAWPAGCRSYGLKPRLLMSPTSQPPHPSHLRNICSYTIFSSLLFLFISPSSDFKAKEQKCEWLSESNYACDVYFTNFPKYFHTPKNSYEWVVSQDTKWLESVHLVSKANCHALSGQFIARGKLI